MTSESAGKNLIDDRLKTGEAGVSRLGFQIKCGLCESVVEFFGISAGQRVEATTLVVFCQIVMGILPIDETSEIFAE